ncbi:MAG TPA: hypothetical protein VG895_01280 [Patescibacteria group bacterium]|nr:hypothetical protein [Patescibacteria group bacterium]
MKKFSVIFLSLFLISTFTLIVHADYASDYQNYINQTGTYNAAHDAYLTARATYIASGSIDSQDKAIQATSQMLQSRDAVFINYLTAIRTKLSSTVGINSTDQSSLTGQINTEISWYQNHASRIPSASTLNDLVNDSNEAQDQYKSSTLDLIYRSLITIGAANNSFIRGELSNEITTLSAKIDEIKANQDKDVTVVSRSLIDVQDKISRSESKDSDAVNNINSAKPNDNQLDNDFEDSQSNLSDSNSYLKEANQEMLQIIAEIKSN